MNRYISETKEFECMNAHDKAMAIITDAVNDDMAIESWDDSFEKLFPDNKHIQELSQKVYKLAEDGKTFVFLGCKVTNYKNGNLKINFSDVKLFEEFKSRFNKALEEAKREYERKQNEKE